MIDHVSPPPTSDTGELKVVKRKASLIGFLRDPVDFFRSLNRHEGSVTQISLGGRMFYVVSDPHLIRDMLATRGNLFEKFPQGNPKQKLFGRGLLTSEGVAQKQQRRMLLPCFHRERLQVYAAEMINCVTRLTSSWHSSEPVDISQAMNDVTLEIIGRTLLGVTDIQLMRELGGHLHTMLGMVNRFVLPWGDILMKLPLPSTLRYHRSAKRLDQMVADLVSQSRARQRGDDLIGILLSTARPDGRPLTDVEIRDEIVTMIVAGHETVAVGLTWCLYLLARDPKLQSELASRLDKTLGDQPPIPGDYGRLAFLQQTFAESLRLYPPIWILGRRNLEEYVFRNLHASPGTIFLVCMADLHRRPEFFADPDVFHPQRWINPAWPSYAYIPFGGGDRRCVGERFAWMEAVFTLATLLKRWNFSTLAASPPLAAAKLTFHPAQPLQLTVTARSQLCGGK